MSRSRTFGVASCRANASKRGGGGRVGELKDRVVSRKTRERERETARRKSEMFLLRCWSLFFTLEERETLHKTCGAGTKLSVPSFAHPLPSLTPLALALCSNGVTYSYGVLRKDSVNTGCCPVFKRAIDWHWRCGEQPGGVFRILPGRCFYAQVELSAPGRERRGRKGEGGQSARVP